MLRFTLFITLCHLDDAKIGNFHETAKDFHENFTLQAYILPFFAFLTYCVRSQCCYPSDAVLRHGVWWHQVIVAIYIARQGVAFLTCHAEIGKYYRHLGKLRQENIS